MKKVSAKRFAGILVAASMFAFSSVFAGAVDYGTTPDYTKPDKSENVGTTEDTPATIVDDKVITDVIASGETTVYVTEDNGSVTVKEDAIGAIAAGDVAVTLVADGYSVTIDPATITDVTAIDIAMEISVNSSAAEVNGVEVPKNAIVIAPAQKGSFGMTLTVTIPAATVKGLDADSLNLYYISDDGDVSKLNSDIEVNSDGSVSVSISHASEYVITDEELEVTGDVDADIEIDDEDDADADDAADDASDKEEDSNPVTGVGLCAGAVLASAAAVAVSKKRK